MKEEAEVKESRSSLLQLPVSDSDWHTSSQINMTIPDDVIVMAAADIREEINRNTN